jgi:hypothetical protein
LVRNPSSNVSAGNLSKTLLSTETVLKTDNEGYNTVHWAAATGNSAVFELLISEHGSKLVVDWLILNTTTDGNVFQLAIEMGHVPLLDFLLKLYMTERHGTKIKCDTKPSNNNENDSITQENAVVTDSGSMKNKQSTEALISNQNNEIVFLDENASELFDSLLETAATSDNFAAFECILSVCKNAQPKRDLQRLVRIATENNRQHFLKVLLNRFDLDPNDMAGDEAEFYQPGWPLRLACVNGWVELTKLLVINPVIDLTLSHPYHKRNCLHSAAFGGSLAVMSTVLETLQTTGQCCPI